MRLRAPEKQKTTHGATISTRVAQPGVVCPWTRRRKPLTAAATRSARRRRTEESSRGRRSRRSLRQEQRARPERRPDRVTVGGGGICCLPIERTPLGWPGNVNTSFACSVHSIGSSPHQSRRPSSSLLILLLLRRPLLLCSFMIMNVRVFLSESHSLAQLNYQRGTIVLSKGVGLP